MQVYSDPSRESDPHALPDVEVFEITLGTSGQKYINGEYVCNPDGELLEPGWYWWPCFPGCLPDSDPIGPFDTEEEALADAQLGAEEEL